MRYEFHSGADLVRLCEEEQLSLSEVMIQNEIEQSEESLEVILAEMRSNLQVMRESIAEALDSEHPVHGVFSGGDALRMEAYVPKALMGEQLAEVVAAGMAVVETNAAMGRIVAAPTAGASGILPAVLVICGGKQLGCSDEKLIEALFAAGAIGCVIAENSGISGAAGGCQAETGTAAAMAAGALVFLQGGSVAGSLVAAAIAIKNCLGLVCDPVAGLVECPCIKRNAIGVANAVLSADLVLAGIGSLIPFDEVVQAMASVGNKMSSDLKETAQGGLAATETGKRLAAQVFGA